MLYNTTLARKEMSFFATEPQEATKAEKATDAKEEGAARQTLLFDASGVMKEPRDKSGVTFRPLSDTDYGRGFCDLLEELTICEASEKDFRTVFNEMKKTSDIYYVVVGEDHETGMIVATGTVFIEKKYIHKGGSVGHIEDIVIKREARGKELGKELISHLVHIAVTKGCYKVILDCNDRNMPFYERCGFHKHENQMARYM